LRIEDEPLLIVLTVLAALVCIPLALLTDGLLLQHGLPTPGAYVWQTLHPHPEPGFLTGAGSLLSTMTAVDSICWFMVLVAVAFLVDRAIKRKSEKRGTG
jgi:hypothetical protein